MLSRASSSSNPIATSLSASACADAPKDGSDTNAYARLRSGSRRREA